MTDAPAQHPGKRVADLIAEDNEREVEFDWESLMKALVAIIAPEPDTASQLHRGLPLGGLVEKRHLRHRVLGSQP